MGKGVGGEPWVGGGFGSHSRAVARLGRGLEGAVCPWGSRIRESQVGSIGLCVKKTRF